MRIPPCVLRFALIICDMENSIKNGNRAEAAEWLGKMYKDLEKFETEHDLTTEEIFGAQIDEIQTQEKGA